MKKNSRWLLFAFAALFLSAVAWKYAVFFWERDFLITDHIPCDPALESCFVQDCDPETDEECDTEPYKRIEKSAAYISMCPNYLSDQCPTLTCGINEEDCAITLCSDDTLEDGEVCVYTPDAVSDSEVESVPEETHE